MHEVSLMMNILETVRRAAEDENADRVTKVVLKVGERSGVVADALRFAFDTASRETVAEGAALEIQTIPLRGECLACGHQFEPERSRSRALICDKCGNFAKAVSGRELTIESIEVA